MTVLQAEFERAAKAATALPQRPSNDDLLKLYALYKQATSGDVSGARPGFLEVAGRAKFDAWGKLAGLSADDAMQGYIKLVKKLQGG